MLVAVATGVTLSACGGASEGGEGSAKTSSQDAGGAQAPANNSAPATADKASSEAAPQTNNSAVVAATHTAPKQTQQAPKPTTPSTDAQIDPKAAPTAAVANFLDLLINARFDEAIAICDPNASGTFKLSDTIDGMKKAKETAGEAVYEAVLGHITTSLKELTWAVVSVDGDRAIVGYKGPRDDDKEKQFEVRRIDGQWLIAPPPTGMPLG